MDKRAATLDATENRWILDGEIYSASSIEFENPAYTLRNFDATRFVVTFQEDTFELGPIKRAVDRLQKNVTEAFSRVPYCM
jgi:hypothetical protein